MKTNKKLIKTQRKSLDEKLQAFDETKSIIRPKSGWLKAIRQAVGMTTSQLAARMGIQQSGVSLLEQREIDKKVTIETLERAAKAMNCTLIYALVPKTNLEAIVDTQSKQSAKNILARTLHTMHLEQQDVGEAESKLHEDELALEIKNKLDSRLWGVHD